MIAAADQRAPKTVGQLAHPFLVGPAHDEHADAVVHDLTGRHHLAGDLRRARHDDVHALVEHHLGAPIEHLVVDVGMQRHAHLSTGREHVDRAVVVLADHDAVGGRRLGQLVDLVAQGGDVLSRLAQRVRELLVLCDGFGQLTLGLEQSLLQRPHSTRCFGEATAQVLDLLTEDVDLV